MLIMQPMVDALRDAWQHPGDPERQRGLMQLVPDYLRWMISAEEFCRGTLYDEAGPVRHPRTGLLVWRLELTRLRTSVREFCEWGDASAEEREHLVLLFAAAMANALCECGSFVMRPDHWKNKL